MEHRFEILTEKKLIGKRMTMSFSENKTGELWSSFMPRRKEIQNSLGTERYSMQIYPSKFYDHFDPATEFEKWAAIEVANFDHVPGGMETYTLAGGLYAVFLYKGAASAATETFRYIFGIWMANSGYEPDTRPHFEILGEKYKNEDPESEEEIWIPVKKKK
jgi:AraC family transcriptional regulator